MAIPDLSSQKPALPPFRPMFNPFIPLLRLSASLLGLICLLLAIMRVIEDFTRSTLKDPKFYLITIPIFIFLYPFMIFFLRLVTRTKNYTFSETFIKEYNFLTLSSKYYDKGEIMGFSTCKIYNRYESYEENIFVRISSTSDIIFK